MDSLKNKFVPGWRRPAKRSSSFRAPAKKWRARSFIVTLPAHKKFVITARKFRTSPARDSKRYRQLIIEFEDLFIRELVFAIQPRPSKRQRRSNATTPFAIPVRMGIATILIVGGLGGSIFFATHLHKQISFNITPAQKVQAITTPIPTKTMPASAPVSLQIPKIGVNSSLQQVGLQANGQMETPWDITTAAWYKYSPTPGQLGPSVIIGHLDGANYAKMAGVFYRLHELMPGDEFSVTRADGTVARFKVLYLKQVPQNENFPTKDIYGNINYAGIRLITCGGTFNPQTGHYSDNTVVFGALE